MKGSDSNLKTEDLKVVVAGGGSTYTPGVVKAMLSSRKKFSFSSLVLYDNDSKRNEDMFVIIDYMLAQEGLTEQVVLSHTTDPETAFTGADFIFSQIRVGGMKMRELDEKIPLKYGLVGQETCGLGGFSYGLRSIKGLLEIVSYVDTYAPDAWLLNYTNPETLVSEAVRRAFPHVHMLNACDMTISIEETIAVNFGYDRKNWIPTYYGLNHFGWYTSIYDTYVDRVILLVILIRLNKYRF